MVYHVLQKMNKMVVSLALVLVFLFSSSVMLASTNQDSSSENGFKIEHDQRPTDLEYALMSRYAYNYESDGLDLEERQEKRQKLDDLELVGWKVYKIRKGTKQHTVGGVPVLVNSYQGIVFKNITTRQLVLAHRGTVAAVSSILEDIEGIVANKEGLQKLEVFIFTKEIVDYAKEEGYHLSFTGHSLGAFLAQLSVFFCHKNYEYPQANAVTFESPGSEEALKSLQSNIKEHEIPLKKLDIVSYVGYPNVINTLRHQIGSLYQVHISIYDYDPTTRNPAEYHLKSHAMVNFVNYFKDNYYKDTDSFSYYLLDWPVSNFRLPDPDSVVDGTFDLIFNPLQKISAFIGKLFIKSVVGGKPLPFDQISKYFSKEYEHSKFDNESNSYSIPIESGTGEKLFDLTYKVHHQVRKGYNSRLELPLKHFSESMQRFLLYFNGVVWGIEASNDDRQRLAEEWAKAGISPEINTYLVGLRIEQRNNGAYIVSLKDVKFEGAASVHPIHDFRFKLSRYLSQNFGKIKGVLSSAYRRENDYDIYAAFIGDGGEVEGDVRDVTYVGVNMPAPTTDDKIKLLKSMHANDVKIVSYVVAPGSRIKGDIVGGVFVGVNFDKSANLESLLGAFNFKRSIEVGEKLDNDQLEL